MMYDLVPVAKMVQSAIEEHIDERRRSYRPKARFYGFRRLVARALFKLSSVVAPPPYHLTEEGKCRVSTI